jgi:hypothetical protein
MKALTKYLRNYAEAETRCLDNFPGGFKQGLVIPIYQERPDTLLRFCQFAEANSGTLLVLIINRPASNTDTQWASVFLQPSTAVGEALWQSTSQKLTLHPLKQKSGLLIVDRCIAGAAIPDNYGVGLARKIGADILCALVSEKKVGSPWIANTDADAILPRDYFDNISHLLASEIQSNATAAIAFPFEHIFIDDTPELPTLLYEFSLHYYVAGLKWANSPYAYQTLGSTLITHYLNYAKVRGFPKRTAAEDFYLLNKLAKTGRIYSPRINPIKLQARESTRVPFGTGPAVLALAQQADPLLMPLYHPDSFLYLQFFQKLLIVLASEPLTVTQAINRLGKIDSDRIDCAQLLAALGRIKFDAALKHSYKQSRKPDSRLQHLQHWFDGFKTLKFIHQLRDQGLNRISFKHWQDNHSDYSFQSTAAMDKLLRRIEILA